MKPRQQEFPAITFHRAELTDAQILANSRLAPSVDQKPCDIGLFSDEANQLDLIEMFMD